MGKNLTKPASACLHRHFLNIFPCTEDDYFVNFVTFTFKISL